MFTQIKKIKRLKQLNERIEQLKKELNATYPPDSLLLNGHYKMLIWNQEEQEELIKNVLKMTFEKKQENVSYLNRELSYLKALGEYLIDLENVQSKRNTINNEMKKCIFEKKEIMDYLGI